MAGAASLPSEKVEPMARSSPGAARAVWLIALRELAEQITSLRFLVISLLVIGLTPLAVFVGVRDYQNRRAEHDRLASERQSLAAGPAGRHVTGMDMPFTPQNDLAVLRALRPPEPLSVLVRGLDGALPEYWDFSSTGFEAGPSASRSERLVDLLGQLDCEFLVRVVLGLLAILLAFDAVAGEKELGTLRAALSQPISRPAFLAGKLAGGAVTLWISVLATFLIGLLSAQLFGVTLLGGDSLAKVVLIATTSAAYLFCMYGLGLFISSLTTSQKTSLVVLLVVWVVAVLALPPLAALVAQAVSPVPPAHAVGYKKRLLDDNLYKEATKEMGLAYQEVMREAGGSLVPGGYEKNKQAIDRRVTPILLGYLSRRRQLVGELDRDVERRTARQNQVARALMSLSPSAAFVRAAADLATTGDAQYGAWLDSVRRQQERLETTLFEDPPLIMFQISEMAELAGDHEPPAGEIEARSTEGEGPPVREMVMVVERHQPPPLSKLPAFAPPRRDAAAALARALPALGLLVAYTGAFIVAGFVAFARYDVR